ncbi:MAG: hypothetical protein N2485_08645, partial [bacterium]|nr:hypothetical protein [bacterium]
MTKEQLKQLFKKLFILKFAPKEEWEFEIYLDEFINTKQEILEQAVDYILKNEVEFPKPATLWKVYN